MSDISVVLAGAIRGTMVGQIALQRKFTQEQIFANDRELIRRIDKELDDLGLRGAELSSAVLDALVMVYASDDVIRGLVPEFAKLLWETLGDPANGGKTPPEAYIEATKMLWITFLGAINPSFLTTIKDMIND